jgi:cytochrome P450
MTIEEKKTEREAVPTGIRLTALDPAFQEDPYPILAKLREMEPVHRDETLNRWVLTRHEDVEELLFDRSLSVDPRNAKPGSFESMFGFAEAERQPSMLFADPPYHTRLRGLVSKAFTARAVEQMRPRIQEIVDELLSAIDAGGEVDLMKEFAEPLPTIVIAEMLGVDPADRADFKRWSDLGVMNFNPMLTPEERALANEATEAMDGYLRRVIEERRAEPRADLVTSLIAAEEGGDKLTDDEIVTMCSLLLAAGNLTTTDLIGNGVWTLLRNRGELKKLQDDPSLIKNAVEEMLRFESPVLMSGRTPLEDRTIAGAEVGAGESVTPILAAANRDPSVYPEPDEFDITRERTDHHSFGGGVHYCLGAPLARAEAQIAVGTLVRRFQEMRLGESPVEWRRVPGFRGLKRLPVLLK